MDSQRDTKVLMLTPYGGVADGLASYSRMLVEELEPVSEVRVWSWNFHTHWERIFRAALTVLPLSFAILKTDVVHVQYTAGLYVHHLLLPLILARICNVHVVMTIHEKLGSSLSHRLLSGVQYLYMQLANELIVHTHVHKESLPKSVQEKIHVIPHGIKVPDTECSAADEIPGRILIPGFVNEWKGHDVAIQAVSRLKVPVQILFVGAIHDEKYGKYVEKEITRLGLTEKVSWYKDFVDDETFHTLLCSACVVLLPYRRITMSGMLAHAIAQRKVTVLSNLDAFKEVAPKGIFFEAGNAAACAQALERALEDGSERSAQQEYFRQLREEYSFKRIAMLTLAIYHE